MLAVAGPDDDAQAAPNHEEHVGGGVLEVDNGLELQHFDVTGVTGKSLQHLRRKAGKEWMLCKQAGEAAAGQIHV
ncbi:MAG: hypothetical protein NVSMB18_04100 [Acetobacteraceae bacterium]